MDKALRPERFDKNPNNPSSAKEFTHWLRTFEYFLDVLPSTSTDSDKLRVLTNYVTPTIFEYFSECDDYQSAVSVLKSIYIKPTNPVFARHLLATRRQQPGESLDQYLQALKILSKDCCFEAVDAKTYSEQSIRDAFIAGI